MLFSQGRAVPLLFAGMFSTIVCANETQNQAIGIAACCTSSGLEYRTSNDDGTYDLKFIDVSVANSKTEQKSTDWNSVESEYQDTVRHYETKSASISSGIGKRIYFNRSQYAPFYQYTGSLRYHYGKTNNYTDLDLDKEESLDKTHYLGMSASISAGVEYFVTPQFSLAGFYQLNTSYTGIKLGGDYDSKSFFLSDYSGMHVSWYWK